TSCVRAKALEGMTSAGRATLSRDGLTISARPASRQFRALYRITSDGEALEPLPELAALASQDDEDLLDWDGRLVRVGRASRYYLRDPKLPAPPDSRGIV